MISKSYVVSSALVAVALIAPVASRASEQALSPQAGELPIVTVALFDHKVNGAGPQSNLIIDTHGNLFGTTFGGVGDGINTPVSLGEIYEIPAGSNQIVDIAPFPVDNSVGFAPFGTLTVDIRGNIFGTTVAGGPGDGGGVIFELIRGTNALKNIGTFTQKSGFPNGAQLAFGLRGEIFGSRSGPNSNCGIFEMSPGNPIPFDLATFPQIPASGPISFPINGMVRTKDDSLIATTGLNRSLIQYHHGVFKTLATFAGEPNGPLILDPAGNIFGTNANDDGSGTIWKLPVGSKGVLNIATIAGSPNGGLVEDKRGNLFGTTSTGGAHNLGSVFEVVATTLQVKILGSFDGTNGAKPLAGVTLDVNGNLFGTTANGGLYRTTIGGDGTVFEIKGVTGSQR